MLDKNLVTLLQKQDKTLQLDELLQAHKTNKPVMMIPEGFSIKSLEGMMKERSSYRFAFSTTSVSDFVEYVKLFDKEGAKCFVDAEAMSAQAVLDVGTEENPLHQEHTAKIQMKKLAAFKAILDHNSMKMTQKQASDFVEDFADFIAVESSEGDSMTPYTAAQLIGKITIETARSLNSEVGDFSESMTSMEKAEVKGAKKFPSKIRFTCKPYPELEAREFVMKVSVLTGDERPRIVFRLVKLEEHEQDIAEEFKELLIGKLEESKTKVFIGVGYLKD